MNSNTKTVLLVAIVWTATMLSLIFGELGGDAKPMIVGIAGFLTFIIFMGD